MPKRMKHMEKFNGASGEDPEYGAIFMSNNSTRKECLSRGLFGLPIGLAGFVKQVKAGMMLFLFEFEKRELHGVFQACSDGAINIEPNAFQSSGKQFPAQVKFTEKWRCRPLCESEFGNAIHENYFTSKKFKFGLSKAQVQRLLKLFSLKKVERSRLREIAAPKPSRKSENTVGDLGFGNRCAGETDGDVDREFPFRVTSAGDHRGRRLTENYGCGEESKWNSGLEYDPTKGNEYSRLVDPKLHGLNDRLGCEVSMNNNSFGTDALTKNSYNSLVNDRRVPKNLRHTASGWLENEYHEKDGIAQASSWSNNKERLNFETDPMVPAQSSVSPDLPYGTNTGYYDPYQPSIMGDTTMTSSRHGLGAPNVDLIGSASYTANSNCGLGEDIIPVGDYVSDALPSETVQPFPDEHNATRMSTSSLDSGFYIPMPIEHHKYLINTGMFGVARGESESDSRNGHLRHSQFPGLSTSAGDTENMRQFERPLYSDRNIFPSFVYPSSSRGLSPKDRLNNELQTYQHQEESRGHVSYKNDMVVRGSSIYPSFTNPSTSGDGGDRADLYLENRANNEVQAYQRQKEFGGDAFDSNNRVTEMKDRVKPAELEGNKTRESVFNRLGGRSKERVSEKDMSPDTESVDEVMAFLNNRHKDWMEQKRANTSSSEDFGKPKKKKEKIHTAGVLDNDLMLPLTETTPDDLLDCEGSMEHTVQKLPFIDFKRRSKAQRSLGNPTQEHSASPSKKRKLLRPKLVEDESEKDRGHKAGPVKIVLASAKDRGNNDPIVKFLASKSATEVPVHDFLGRNESDSQKDRGKNDNPIENVLASQSATEVPVHDFLGRNEGDSQKERGKNDNPIENVLASQSATEVPVHDFLGRDEGDSQKERGKNDNPIENLLASQSATEVHVHDFFGRDEDDLEKDRGKNDDPVENFLASEFASKVPFHDFLGCDDR
ncbi:Development/cell death domain [Arabidopsis suecica]|uniref:Development/cell death domain n=2 Tax=Arabidopsis suecica TaxID=45249 RepID=A0A8T2ALW3_ARASU|nr:Development/cell death domain [Arabidopsis suecica]KAG7573666.1 Development/cell death domain [Arabidopsis suecica]KAG7573667.1 Development/cell death domain [Arabidopsis suecica]KAG7573668.1 Development/cell death domain [Arabidopsis suecica]KAG7573669.1 Development/cell death domain [Arabidopsis suecica]